MHTCYLFYSSLISLVLARKPAVNASSRCKWRVFRLQRQAKQAFNSEEDERKMSKGAPSHVSKFRALSTAACQSQICHRLHGPSFDQGAEGLNVDLRSQKNSATCQGYEQEDG